MTRKLATSARFEPSTKTIRSVPENYWLASMDSWDGAIDHGAMALIFAAAPDMLVALKNALPWLIKAENDDCFQHCAAPLGGKKAIERIQAAIAKATAS